MRSKQVFVFSRKAIFGLELNRALHSDNLAIESEWFFFFLRGFLFSLFQNKTTIPLTTKNYHN